MAVLDITENLVCVLNIREMQPFGLLTQRLVCTRICIETEKKPQFSFDQMLRNKRAAELVVTMKYVLVVSRKDRVFFFHL